MRPARKPFYSSMQRCNVNRRLRHRLRAAEAQAARADRRAEAAEAQAETVKRNADHERATLVALLESAEWKRDLLRVMQAELDRALMGLAREGAGCARCSGMTAEQLSGLFSGAADQLERTLGLAPNGARPVPGDWPARLGLGLDREPSGRVGVQAIHHGSGPGGFTALDPRALSEARAAHGRFMAVLDEVETVPATAPRVISL